jgi:hypothetical protein
MAITDTDSKERKALATVFRGIFLRICRFHLKQCWKNKLNHDFSAKSLDTKKMKIKMKTLTNS